MTAISQLIASKHLTRSKQMHNIKCHQNRGQKEDKQVNINNQIITLQSLMVFLYQNMTRTTTRQEQT